MIRRIFLRNFKNFANTAVTERGNSAKMEKRNAVVDESYNFRMRFRVVRDGKDEDCGDIGHTRKSPCSEGGSA